MLSRCDFLREPFPRRCDDGFARLDGHRRECASLVDRCQRRVRLLVRVALVGWPVRRPASPATLVDDRAVADGHPP